MNACRRFICAWHRFLCAIEIHDFELVGKHFKFCRRPQCHDVSYRTGEGYYELDVCDTRWVEWWYDIDVDDLI